MNGKFQEKYGKTWKDMDADTRQMVLMSEIFDLREDIKPLIAACEVMKDDHKTLTVIKWVGGILSSAIIISLVTLFFEVVKNR